MINNKVTQALSSTITSIDELKEGNHDSKT